MKTTALLANMIAFAVGLMGVAFAQTGSEYQRANLVVFARVKSLEVEERPTKANLRQSPIRQIPTVLANLEIIETVKGSFSRTQIRVLWPAGAEGQWLQSPRNVLRLFTINTQGADSWVEAKGAFYEIANDVSGVVTGVSLPHGGDAVELELDLKRPDLPGWEKVFRFLILGATRDDSLAARLEWLQTLGTYEPETIRATIDAPFIDGWDWKTVRIRGAALLQREYRPLTDRDALASLMLRGLFGEPDAGEAATNLIIRTQMPFARDIFAFQFTDDQRLRIMRNGSASYAADVAIGLLRNDAHRPEAWGVIVRGFGRGEASDMELLRKLAFVLQTPAWCPPVNATTQDIKARIELVRKYVREKHPGG